MNNSKEYIVTTVSGKQLPRNKCRYIKKEYYEINVECFLMPDGCWHRINNGKIVYDHEFNKYVLIEQTNLIEGIVGVKEDGSFSFGCFSVNPSKNVMLDDYHCISYEIAESLGAMEDISSGNYVSKEKFKPSMKKKGINGRYTVPIDYSAGPRIPMFTKAYNEMYVPQNVNNLRTKFAKELGDTSFGFELESDNGFIPERFLLKNGLIPLKDGSLRHDNIEPYEYTTIPLSGEKGIYTMVDIVDLFNKYTEISDRCALHLHLGGIAPSKELVVSLHRLILSIQDEIYSMFPSNYKYTSDNGFKKKDYCAPFSQIRLLKKNSIDENFDIIYSHLSGGHGRFSGFNTTNHPKDTDARHKWDVQER